MTHQAILREILKKKNALKGIKIYFTKVKKQRTGFHKTIKPTEAIIEKVVFSKRDKTPILVYSYLSLEKNIFKKRTTACLPLIKKVILQEEPKLNEDNWSTGRIFFTKKEEAEQCYQKYKEALSSGTKCDTTCNNEVLTEEVI